MLVLLATDARTSSGARGSRHLLLRRSPYTMTRSRQGQQASFLLAHALQAAFSNAEYGVTAMRGTAGRYSNWLEPSSHDDLRRLEEAARACSN